jgi:hypothetical protein
MSELDGRTSFLRLFEQHLSFAPAYPNKPQDTRTPAKRRQPGAATWTLPKYRGWKEESRERSRLSKVGVVFAIALGD